MSTQHERHLALAATHFKKLAQHHLSMSELHKSLAQSFFEQVAEGDMQKGAETGHLSATHKSFAEHHMQMHKHSLAMAKALAQGTPNVDEETQTNVPAAGSDTFEDAASTTFEKQFGLDEPRFSAVGTLQDPRKISSKLVFRPGQEELFASFDKVASASDESDTLPGMPPFEKVS
jgi:hypothetical protein